MNSKEKFAAWSIFAIVAIVGIVSATTLYMRSANQPQGINNPQGADIAGAAAGGNLVGDANAFSLNSRAITKTVAAGTALGDPSAFGPVLNPANTKFLENTSAEIRFTSPSAGNAASFESPATFNPSSLWKAPGFLEARSGAFGYYYVFGNPLVDPAENFTSDIGVIHFLGKDLIITGYTDQTITVLLGKEYILRAGGPSVKVGGKNVKLINVASGPAGVAIVDVDNVRKTVVGTETVNGIRIKVGDTIMSYTLQNRYAQLFIAADGQIVRTFSSGDEYIGEDANNPAWVWDIHGLESPSPTLGVKWALNLDSWDETDNPLYPHAIYPGESFNFPNNFAKIRLTRVTTDKNGTVRGTIAIQG